MTAEAKRKQAEGKIERAKHTRETCPIPASSIDIPGRHRPLDPAKVDELANSMAAIGLIHPIVIREAEDHPKYCLVTGGHRLAAAKRLGWEWVACEIVELDDRKARMFEIAENLHRAELTALERSEQVAEWIRLCDDGDKLAQVAPVSEKGGRGNKGGINAATRELGVERTEAQRAVKVDGLDPAAKAEAIRVHA